MRSHLASGAPDPRDVLGKLHSIGAMARYLITQGYPEVQIKTVLVREFPGADVERAYADAAATTQHHQED